MGAKKTLWLTYAWVDNEDADVDFVVRRLESHGIEVRLDRTRIVVGQRLWQQIDRNLLADDLDGFAIYVTESSLRSEPCQEELAIALDRVLRQKGAAFPLIGIFPHPIERQLIPSSIATRLFVSLKDENWSSRVVAALSAEVNQTIADVPPYYFKEHQIDSGYVYEMRPREGVWHPAIVMVLSGQRPICGLPFVWAKDQPHYSPSMFQLAELPEQQANDGTSWQGFRVDQQVDSTKSVYLPTKEKLKRIAFGKHGRTPIIDIP